MSPARHGLAANPALPSGLLDRLIATAEAILKLRALIDNGDFDVYWTHHLAREHERLYPIPDQDNYGLTD